MGVGVGEVSMGGVAGWRELNRVGLGTGRRWRVLRGLGRGSVVRVGGCVGKGREAGGLRRCCRMWAGAGLGRCETCMPGHKGAATTMLRTLRSRY